MDNFKTDEETFGGLVAKIGSFTDSAEPARPATGVRADGCRGAWGQEPYVGQGA